jgi:O-antigen/teichoic acid export membrane protein
MQGLRRILRGAAWNWLAFAISAGVAFFIAPFVVRHLGNTTYGVWVLVNSAVSYLALLDLGMRGTVVRFVAVNQPRGLHAEASHAVSAALWFRIFIAVPILLAGALLALFIDRIFHVPPEMLHDARWAIFLSSLNLAVSLTFSLFSGVLNALHRFDLISSVGMAQTVSTAWGLVILLRRGHSIVAMASLQFVIALLASAALAILAFWTYPELRISLKAPQKPIIRELWSYSFFLFLIAAAGRVIYYTDNLVIAVALPVSAVTFYAIGANVTEYLRNILSSIGVTFMPAASNLDAPEHRPQLQHLLVQGTRAILLVALPIEVALYLRGVTFIRLWMGPEYGDPSGQVLRVLLLAWFVLAGNFCGANIAFGLAKHRMVAAWTAMEAVANLSLSIFLVRRVGIIGVAWGTVIPSLVINGIVWPIYITKMVGMSLRAYLRQAWLQPALAAVPYALACYLSDRFWPATNLFGFFLQIAILLPIFFLGVLVSFGHEAVAQLRRGTTWLAALVRT